MDLILINAHRYVSGYLPGSNLGINVLLQVIRNQGYQGEMLQGFVNEISSQLKERMQSKERPSIVGFYSDFNNIFWTKKLIIKLKQNHPEVIVLIGGPQAVGIGEAFIRETGADVICIGDGEEMLLEIMDFYIKRKGTLKEIDGIRYLDSEARYIETKPRITQKTPDVWPWPDMALSKEYAESKLFPILTGRGCPMECTFCYEGANAKKVRLVSEEKVLDEITYSINNEKDIRYVNFLDDTFTLNKERVVRICNGMKKIRESNDIVWFASGHINRVFQNPGMVRIMAEAGLVKLFFGIESGSDMVLQKYHKQSDRDMILKTIKQCVEEKLPFIAGNIIFGGPFENEETFQDSVSLVDELLELGPGQIDMAFFGFLPYPNTAITKNPEMFGLRIYSEWIDCCLEDIPLTSSEYYSYDEMSQLRLKASYELQRKMHDLYKQNKIPEKVILDSYYYKNKYGIYSRWNEYVYSRYPIDSAYWNMRASGKYSTYKDIVDKDNAIPKRTFNIWDYLDATDSSKKIQGNTLSEMAFYLLKLCNGKQKLRTVLGEICERFGWERVKEAQQILKNFEGHRWILYAQI